MSRLFIKRIHGDIKDLNRNRMEFVQAIQDEQNIKLFYFMLRPKDPPYGGGLYIGKIELPDDYPKTPGSFYMLTPSGRFTINAKICLTNSSYHRENWTPIWSIRNMIIGVSSIFVADDTTGISHIKDTKENRERMAKTSIEFNLKYFPDIFNRFDFFVNQDNSIKSDEEIDKIVNIRNVNTCNVNTCNVNTSVVIDVVVIPELIPEPILKPILELIPEPILKPILEPIKKVKCRIIKKKKQIHTDEVQIKIHEEEKVQIKIHEEEVPIKKIIRRIVKKKEQIHTDEVHKTVHGEDKIVQTKIHEEEVPIKKVKCHIVKKKEQIYTDKVHKTVQCEDKIVQTKIHEEEVPIKKVIRRIVKKKEPETVQIEEMTTNKVI